MTPENEELKEAERRKEELTGVLESNSVGDASTSTSTSSGKDTTVDGIVTLS